MKHLVGLMKYLFDLMKDPVGLRKILSASSTSKGITKLGSFEIDTMSAARVYNKLLSTELVI